MADPEASQPLQTPLPRLRSRGPPPPDKQQVKAGRKPNKAPERPAGKVLIVTFEFCDFPEIDAEVAKVKRTFERRGYKVDTFKIPMEDSQRALEEAMKKFLPSKHSTTGRFIYYSGHGGISKEKELFLASHNLPDKKAVLQMDAQALSRTLFDVGETLRNLKLPPDPKGKTSNASKTSRTSGASGDDKVSSESTRSVINNCITNIHHAMEQYQIYRPTAWVSWTGIQQLIMDAPCELAMILDCCHSGAAAIFPEAVKPNLKEFNDTVKKTATKVKLDRKYPKELLSAASWESSTYVGMSDAICEVLNNESHSISVETLHDRIYAIQSRKEKPRAAQPVRVRLNESGNGRKVRIMSMSEL